jgi:hypothetical protein
MEGDYGQMDQKIKISSCHPYKHLELEKEWRIISKALRDLSQNNDIIIKTPDSYVIGYLVKKIKEG